MGDFLSRLSDRALGRVPLARPASASLFDPGPVERIGAAIGNDVGAADAIAPRPDLPQGAKQGVAASAAPALLAPPAAIADGQMSPSQAASHAALRVPEHSTASHPGSKRSSAASETSEAATPSAEEAPPPVAPQVQREASLPARRAAPAPLVNRAAPPAAASAAAPATLAELAQASGRNPDAGGRPQAATRRDRAAASEAPTIRVSIGRVEVRAVMSAGPQPPATRAARQSGLMSLDDYLKRSRS